MARRVSLIVLAAAWGGVGIWMLMTGEPISGGGLVVFAVLTVWGTLRRAMAMRDRSLRSPSAVGEHSTFDPDSWEYQKAYSMSAALKRWGVPSSIRALLGLLLMPPFVMIALFRAARRRERRT